MTASPDLDALEALLAKATPGKAIIEVNPAYMADVVRAAVNALPSLIAIVRAADAMRRAETGRQLADATETYDRARAEWGDK